MHCPQIRPNQSLQPTVTHADARQPVAELQRWHKAMKTTVLLIAILLSWRTSCISQAILWNADSTREALLSSNDLAVVSSDFALKYQSDHLADHLIRATGHVADAFQHWVSINQNLKVIVGISTFDTSAHLVAALNEWHTTSTMSPPPVPVTIADLGGRNYYINIFVGPLYPTAETNSKPYRRDVDQKVTETIQEKLDKLIWKTTTKEVPTTRSSDLPTAGAAGSRSP